ncbi:MAG: TPM domain-containing protein, partial [Verrucomicrobiales bacterium]|nr:TPM domain-containing protein [Verrucomicrobiales bacterium]
MPVSALRFSFFLLAGLGLPFGYIATAQESDFKRIDDQARIFTSPEAAASKAAIEKQFTALNLETGVELFVLTVSTATGTSAREIAASKVDS